MNSVNMIKDVRLKVTLRVGSKMLLLNDIVNMDLGSVVELERKYNEPLEILVEGVLIGYGEVVTTNGNFGVKIISLVNEAS